MQGRNFDMVAVMKDLFNQAKTVEKGIGSTSDDMKLESCISILNIMGLEANITTTKTNFYSR